METDNTQKKGGRPRKTENVKRDKICTFRLTEEEEKQLQQHVEDYGGSQSEFIRKAVLKKRFFAKIKENDIDVLRKHQENLQRIGVNINAIARAANTHKEKIAVEELTKASTECISFLALVKSIRNEMMRIDDSEDRNG
jgi:Arc/MetJ-type ribon-helix-helix transcriptional regulator